MSGRSRFVASLVVALVVSSAAGAQEDSSPVQRSSAFQLSGGVFNVGKSPTQAEVGLELRRPTPWWKLDAAGGVAFTEEGSVWVYGGLRLDWDVSERVVISPGFAIALYEEGDGKDLGGVVEFRSSIDFGYRITNKARLGVMFYHLSNAGLYDQNPGANSAVVTYSVRLK